MLSRQHHGTPNLNGTRKVDIDYRVAQHASAEQQMAESVSLHLGLEPVDKGFDVVVGRYAPLLPSLLTGEWLRKTPARDEMPQLLGVPREIQNGLLELIRIEKLQPTVIATKEDVAELGISAQVRQAAVHVCADAPNQLRAFYQIV
jgi:hypothetical protein